MLFRSCKYCGKYYADEACTKEITLADTVVKFVPDEEEPAVPGDKTDGTQNPPKTGDNSGIAAFIIMLIAAATAAGGFAIKRRREQ